MYNQTYREFRHNLDISQPYSSLENLQVQPEQQAQEAQIVVQGRMRDAVRRALVHQAYG